MNVLSKGLSSRGISVVGLKVDLFKCLCQIKLQHFFSQSKVTPILTPFGSRADFALMCLMLLLIPFVVLVEHDIMKTTTQPPCVPQKLTSKEKILTELMNNKDLVMKPADKGGAIVVQDAVKYKVEIFSQLSDEKFDKKLTSDPTDSFQQNVLPYLEKAKQKGWISKSEFEFLYNQHPIYPLFYALPKIHKSLVNPSGRPTVA